MEEQTPSDSTSLHKIHEMELCARGMTHLFRLSDLDTL